MATLADLLNNFGLAEDEGEEKVASETSQATDDSEQALLENLLSGEGEEKVASEGDGQMGSLAELYMQLSEHDAGGVTDDDFDKVAELAAYDDVAVNEEEAIEKVAAEYDAAGRIMARGFYDELNKLAEGSRELEEGSDASTPALGDRGTQWQMETNMAPKGQLVTKGSGSVNADAIKGGAGTDLGAQSAMGPQFTTAKHLVTSRAAQANAK
ncbi:MAG: hypothetical protein ACYTBJ_05385 [Planctomycetota bacterium]|jgi:hypothetical protein